MHRHLALLAFVICLTASCATVQERIDGLDLDIDIDAVLDQVRDCDALSDRLVGLARRGADAADELAARTEGSVPDAALRDTVDQLAISRFFELAERIGCTSLEFRLETIENLRGLATESEAGDRLIEQILEELQAQGAP